MRLSARSIQNIRVAERFEVFLIDGFPLRYSVKAIRGENQAIVFNSDGFQALYESENSAVRSVRRHNKGASFISRGIPA
jgi:hypothetical protein